MAINPRTQTTARTALTLDGVPVPDLRAIEGLELEADIVGNDLGPDNRTKKHVSNVRWTPALATIGIGMGKAMGTWLGKSLGPSPVPVSGSVVTADFDYKAKSAHLFSNAVLTRFTVPTLDGANKEPGTLLVGFEAEQVKVGPADGTDIRPKTTATKPKSWACSNFRVEISKLPCARVAKIESFTWTRAAPVAGIGGVFRDPAKVPARGIVPDIQLSIAIADHQAWSDAAKAWFIDGKRQESDEMAGRIVLLAPDMKTELAVISFGNMGFRRFQTLAAAQGEAVSRFSVTLYAEWMDFELKG